MKLVDLLPTCRKLSLCQRCSHLETTAKLLIPPERISVTLSKCPLKSLENQSDFDSAIRRFEFSRPSQKLQVLKPSPANLHMPGGLEHIGNDSEAPSTPFAVRLRQLDTLQLCVVSERNVFALFPPLEGICVAQKPALLPPPGRAF